MFPKNYEIFLVHYLRNGEQEFVKSEQALVYNFCKYFEEVEIKPTKHHQQIKDFYLCTFKIPNNQLIHVNIYLLNQ